MLYLYLVNMHTINLMAQDIAYSVTRWSLEFQAHNKLFDYPGHMEQWLYLWTITQYIS